MDEIDKIAKKRTNVSIIDACFCEGATSPSQDYRGELLPCACPKADLKHPQQERSKQIKHPFIVGGAFDGIGRNCQTIRLRKSHSDFGQNNKAIDENSSYMQEIIAEGIQNSIIPELIGRLPVLQLLSN